jgi:hypothetical protein
VPTLDALIVTSVPFSGFVTVNKPVLACVKAEFDDTPVPVTLLRLPAEEKPEPEGWKVAEGTIEVFISCVCELFGARPEPVKPGPVTEMLLPLEKPVALPVGNGPAPVIDTGGEPALDVAVIGGNEAVEGLTAVLLSIDDGPVPLELGMVEFPGPAGGPVPLPGSQVLFAITVPDGTVDGAAVMPPELATMEEELVSIVIYGSSVQVPEVPEADAIPSARPPHADQVCPYAVAVTMIVLVTSTMTVKVATDALPEMMAVTVEAPQSMEPAVPVMIATVASLLTTQELHIMPL